MSDHLTEDELDKMWEKASAALGLDGTDASYIATMDYIVTKDVPV